jgi:ABC-2 type transport system ATP-binding protein
VDKSVEVEGLTKRFGPIVAVDNISFTVESGESLCFLGPNGAGKSTAMKMITGFLPPTAGSVTVCGHDVIRQPIEAKRRIGYLPEGAPLYGEMSPKSLLNFVADIRRLSPEQKRRGIDYAIECLHLENVLYQPIETLSKGYKRRVGLAQAIVHDPDVLILDEPTDGLDPNQKHEVRNLLREMSGDKAIIISTHILEEVDAVCSRAIIISRGRIVADQTPAQLEEHSRFHNAVGIRIPSDRVEHCVTLLNQIGEVSAVETKVQPNGLGELTAFPAEGCEILDLVRSMIDREGLDVAEIYVDRGRLDDVFRDLTIGGTSPPPASDKSLL